MPDLALVAAVCAAVSLLSGCESSSSGGDKSGDEAGDVQPLLEETPDTGISSFFSTDSEGWSILGDAQKGTGIPNYKNASSSGGYIAAEDDVFGDTCFFNAPAEFLGDLSAYYGGKLSFYLKQNRIQPYFDFFDDPDVILRSESQQVFFSHEEVPGSEWTLYETGMTEQGWTTEEGEPVDPSDFLAILTNVTGLEIRGEFVDGPDIAYLDNVWLQVAP